MGFFLCIAATVVMMVHGNGLAIAAAETMQVTVYDDGLACPGGCDPHVVFDKRHNGTENAFKPPLANRSNPAAHRCVPGEVCMICFDAGDDSCLEVLYRGDGPHEQRFDFTAAFMLEACQRTTSLPAALQGQCSEMAKAAGGKLSCIAIPDHPSCQELIAEARAAQTLDRPEFLSCEELGVVAYNKTQADPQRHRSRQNGCAYAENLRGKNSKGQTWQRLMPGACRDNTFVGRDGLDCCTGVPLIDASFGRSECALYYR